MISSKELEALLEDNGFTVVTQTRKEIRCLCIWHKDDNTSFSISKKTGKWICFSGCGSGEFDALLKKLKVTLKVDLKKKIKELLELKLNKPETNTQKINEIQFPPSFEIITKEKTPESAYNYIIGRLKFETIKRFNLYYCKRGYYKDRIIVPIYYKEKLVSFISRSVNPDEDKRYLNPIDHIMSNYLFNYDAIQKNSDVLICESSFDCMSAVEKGYESTVSTFGAHISDKQKELITALKPRKIIVCFHSDKAGNTEYYTRLKYLKTITTVERVFLPNDTDINECTKDQFDECIKNRVNMSSTASYLKDKTLKKLRNL